MTQPNIKNDKLNVLVVDDEVILCQSVEKILKEKVIALIWLQVSPML